MPGLAAHFTGVADDVFPAAPALSRWLARAAVEPFAADGMEQAALALFSVTPAGHGLPVAPFRYLADTMARARDHLGRRRHGDVTSRWDVAGPVNEPADRLVVKAAGRVLLVCRPGTPAG